jgi:hypothetical protein
MSRSLLTLAALFALGCATAPWTRIAVTGGGAVQRLPTRDPALGDLTADGAMNFRAEVDFLQLVGPEARDFDIGPGYAFFDLPDGQRTREARSAVMLAGRYHLWIEDDGDGGISRLSIGGNVDVLLYARGFGGIGGTVTLDLEVATRTELWGGGGAGSSPSGFFIGAGAVAPGEAGIGLRAEAGYHVLDDGTHRFMLTAGVVVRFPAIAFIGIAAPTDW